MGAFPGHGVDPAPASGQEYGLPADLGAERSPFFDLALGRGLLPIVFCRRDILPFRAAVRPLAAQRLEVEEFSLCPGGSLELLPGAL